MPVRDRKAGERLRKLRERVGLTLRDVEQLSTELAHRRDPRLRVPASRLSDIEQHGRVPSIFCLHALATAYDVDIRKLLAFYLRDQRRRA